MHLRDHGLGTAVDRTEHVRHRLGVAHVLVLAELERAAHPVHVGAAAERLALTGEDDDADGRLFPERQERVAKLRDQLGDVRAQAIALHALRGRGLVEAIRGRVGVAGREHADGARVHERRHPVRAPLDRLEQVDLRDLVEARFLDNFALLFDHQPLTGLTNPRADTR